MQLQMQCIAVILQKARTEVLIFISTFESTEENTKCIQIQENLCFFFGTVIETFHQYIVNCILSILCSTLHRCGTPVIVTFFGPWLHVSKKMQISLHQRCLSFLT